MTYFQNWLVTQVRVWQLFTQHQIWQNLIESITTLRKGQWDPIRVFVICNPWRGLWWPGCNKSWTQERDFLVHSAMWWLFFSQAFFQLIIPLPSKVFYNICWLVRLFWGFTSLSFYFSHIATWKQEIPNLWNFSGKTWSWMTFSIFVNCDLGFLLLTLKNNRIHPLLMVHTCIISSMIHFKGPVSITRAHNGPRLTGKMVTQQIPSPRVGPLMARR